MRKLLFIISVICFLVSGKAQIDNNLKLALNKTLDSMTTVIKSKSLSAAIQFSDDEIWSHASGISSQSPLVKAEPEMAYLIGSVTKTITSACILKLWDQNKLNIDDKYIRYLNPIIHVDTNITIRQMLRHQSGIYDVLANTLLTNEMLTFQQKIFDPKVFIPQYIKPKLFTAGAKWDYSNTNYFLLGMIIESVTGKPFYQVLREEFYEAYNLNSFGIPAFENYDEKIAHVWMDLNGDQIVEDGHNFYQNYKALNSVAGAAGGYYSNASDLARWIRLFIGKDVVSESSIQAAKETVFSAGLPDGTYGLGLMKKKFQGLQGYGHGGDLAYSANAWYFPEKDFSITILNNDARNISWTLVPVVNELIKTYQKWQLTQTNDEHGFEIVCQNPVSEKLEIKSKDNLLSIDIIKNNGQYLFKGQQLNEGTNSFDLTKPGLYHVVVWKNGKVMINSKVVKV